VTKQQDPFWMEGWLDFHESGVELVNPYPEGSDGWEGYRRGWKAAEKCFELKTGDDNGSKD